MLKNILISDFTINNLAGYLSNLSEQITYTSIIAPFNQVQQVLLNPNLDCWESKPDFTFIFCQPQRVIKSFDKLLNNQPVEIDVILNEVDEFVEQLKISSSRVKFTIVASFTFNPNVFIGASAFTLNNGISYVISRMNCRLSKQLTQANGFYLLDAQRWISKVGVNAFQPKNWYLSKTPFHHSVFEIAANEINAVVKTIHGFSKKLIVIDLDDTMWGGIVGDIGWENLILGGHNALGEAYVDFQKLLLAISNKGIQLALVSKNEESIALNAIEKHPEMILKKNNFVAWKINWKDKAQNIFELSEDLKIGLDAIVFIDDNPAERARVKEAFPQIFVPQMPDDKLLYPSFINELDCFSSTILSNEDINRTAYYKDEKSRSENRLSFQSIDAWLASIKIKIKIERVNKQNIQRVAQLFNKTNQMNLSTRRMSEKELLDATADSHFSCWAVYLTDKFGDAGLIGILGLEFTDKTAQIIDFILSCRVMGRKCEETMLNFAIKLAKEHHCKTVLAEYKPTPKNKPCLDFYKNSGFDQDQTFFTWNCDTPYNLPSYIAFTYEN